MTTKSATTKISAEETLSALIEQNAVQEKAIKDLQTSTAQLHDKIGALAALVHKKKDGITREEVNNIMMRQTAVIKNDLNALLQQQKTRENELQKALSASIKTGVSDVIRQLPETKNEHKNHYAAGVFISGILLVLANIFAVISFILRDLNFQELNNARRAAYIYRQYNKVDSAIIAAEHPETMPLLQRYHHATEHIGADSVIHVYKRQRQEQSKENAKDHERNRRNKKE